MTLADLVKQAEQSLTVGPEGVTSPAPTGEPYVILTSGGIKLEGGRIPILCATPELAIEHYSKALTEYRRSFYSVSSHWSGYTIYWRKKPRLEHIVREGSDYWFVYSRLLISKEVQNDGQTSS